MDTTKVQLDEETLKHEVNEDEESTEEERVVGTSDEGDQDPDDTTPLEAEELADEGKAIIDQMRKERHN